MRTCCPDCLTKYSSVPASHSTRFRSAKTSIPGLAHDRYPNEAALMPVSIAYQKQRPPLPALRRIPQYRISAVILAPLREIASVKAYLGCVKQTTQSSPLPGDFSMLSISYPPRRKPTPCPEIMVEPDCEHSRVFKQFIARIP